MSATKTTTNTTTGVLLQSPTGMGAHTEYQPINSAMQIYKQPEFAQLTMMIESCKYFFQEALFRCPQSRQDFRFSAKFTNEDTRFYNFDSPFNCADIEKLVIDKNTDQVQLPPKPLSFPAGRGVTFHAYDPLAIVNAMLKAKPTGMAEDGILDTWFVKNNIPKNEDTMLYFIPAHSTAHRKTVRTFDGMTFRLETPQDPLAFNSRSPEGILEPTDERYPLMRLYHDLMLMLPVYRTEVHPENVSQCVPHFINQFFTDNQHLTGIFDCDYEPRRVKARINKAQLLMEYDRKYQWNYYKYISDGIEREFNLYPDPQHPLKYTFLENAYFLIPEELVTQEMRRKAYEFENSLKHQKTVAFRAKYGPDVPMQLSAGFSNKIDPSDLYDETRLAMIDSTQIFTVYYPMWSLSVDNHLRLLSVMLTTILKNCGGSPDIQTSIFLEAFNKEFERRDKLVKDLFIKSKHMSVLQLQYDAVKKDYTAATQKLKLTTLENNPDAIWRVPHVDDFLDDEGHEESEEEEIEPPKRTRGKKEKPETPEERRARKLREAADSLEDLIGKPFVGSRDVERQKASAERALLNKASDEDKKRAQYFDFFVLQSRVTDLENQLKVVTQEVKDLDSQLETTGPNKHLLFFYNDLLRLQNQNCFIDLVNEKKYFLFTSNSPTYIHLYEEPLHYTDLQSPPPFYLKQYGEFVEYERVRNQELMLEYKKKWIVEQQHRVLVSRQVEYLAAIEERVKAGEDITAEIPDLQANYPQNVTDDELPPFDEKSLLIPKISMDDLNVEEQRQFEKFLKAPQWQRDLLTLFYNKENRLYEPNAFEKEVVGSSYKVDTPQERVKHVNLMGRPLDDSDIAALLNPNIYGFEEAIEILQNIERKNKNDVPYPLQTKQQQQQQQQQQNAINRMSDEIDATTTSSQLINVDDGKDHRYFKPIVINQQEREQFINTLDRFFKNRQSEDFSRERAVRAAQQDDKRVAQAVKRDEQRVKKLFDNLFIKRLAQAQKQQQMPPPIPIPNANNNTNNDNNDNTDNDKYKDGPLPPPGPPPIPPLFNKSGQQQPPPIPQQQQPPPIPKQQPPPIPQQQQPPPIPKQQPPPIPKPTTPAAPAKDEKKKAAPAKTTKDDKKAPPAKKASTSTAPPRRSGREKKKMDDSSSSSEDDDDEDEDEDDDEDDEDEDDEDEDDEDEDDEPEPEPVKKGRGGRTTKQETPAAKTTASKKATKPTAAITADDDDSEDESDNEADKKAKAAKAQSKAKSNAAAAESKAKANAENAEAKAKPASRSRGGGGSTAAAASKKPSTDGGDDETTTTKTATTTQSTATNKNNITSHLAANPPGVGYGRRKDEKIDALDVGYNEWDGIMCPRQYDASVEQQMADYKKAASLYSSLPPLDEQYFADRYDVDLQKHEFDEQVRAAQKKLLEEKKKDSKDKKTTKDTMDDESDVDESDIDGDDAALKLISDDSAHTVEAKRLKKILLPVQEERSEENFEFSFALNNGTLIAGGLYELFEQLTELQDKVPVIQQQIQRELDAIKRAAEAQASSSSSEDDTDDDEDDSDDDDSDADEEGTSEEDDASYDDSPRRGGRRGRPRKDQSLPRGKYNKKKRFVSENTDDDDSDDDETDDRRPPAKTKSGRKSTGGGRGRPRKNAIIDSETEDEKPVTKKKSKWLRR